MLAPGAARERERRAVHVYVHEYVHVYVYVYVHVCAYVFVYVYVNVYVHVYVHVYVTGKLLAPGAARERQRRAFAPGSDGVSSQGPASLHHLPFSRLFLG